MRITAQVIQGWLNGENLSTRLLVRHAKLLILIALLLLVYILSGYRAVRQQKEIERLQKEVTDLHTEAQTIATKRTEMTRLSAIQRQLQHNGSPVQRSFQAPVKVW